MGRMRYAITRKEWTSTRLGSCNRRNALAGICFHFFGGYSGEKKKQKEDYWAWVALR